MIGGFILKFIGTTIVKRVVVALLKELAKRTDNTIDDAIVGVIEHELL